MVKVRSSRLECHRDKSSLKHVCHEIIVKRLALFFKQSTPSKFKYQPLPYASLKHSENEMTNKHLFTVSNFDPHRTLLLYSNTRGLRGIHYFL